MAIINLSSDNFDKIVNNNEIVIIDFGQNSFAPCLEFSHNF